MKAALYKEYGSADVVSAMNVVKPKPGDNDVLIKVKYTAVTAADARIRGAIFPKGFGFLARLAFGIGKPRNQILGSCFSGVIEAVGKDVDVFKSGDEVCGMSGIKMGAHAEYIVVNARKSLAIKPQNVTHKDAAGMLFGGTAALYFLRDQARVKQGESVLVNGASGAVGTNAVQIARHLGASVTGVTSGDSADLVKLLGAENIIDYTKESIFDSEKEYDVVLDAVGNINIKAGKEILTKQGRLVLMVASLGEILRSQSDGRVKTGTATEKKEDIEFLLQLMERGELKTVIDSEYLFDDIVEAHKRVSGGDKKGNVMVRVA
ncbi:MAG TPA: NAD(P)-dependent alcohol dehydrogenase [Candidatus Saccharimonadales bacterium]